MIALCNWVFINNHKKTRLTNVFAIFSGLVGTAKMSEKKDIKTKEDVIQEKIALFYNLNSTLALELEKITQIKQEIKEIIKNNESGRIICKLYKIKVGPLDDSKIKHIINDNVKVIELKEPHLKKIEKNKIQKLQRDKRIHWHNVNVLKNRISKIENTLRKLHISPSCL